MHKLRKWRNAHIIIIAVSLNVYKGRAEKHTRGGASDGQAYTQTEGHMIKNIFVTHTTIHLQSSSSFAIPD